MVKGETVRLKVIGINKRVTFNTTDWKVADVNYNGWIKADKIGKATITAEVDNKKRRCVVRVIGLNKTSIKIKVGEKYKLKINGIISRVKYTSNNKEIALVDRKGIIKGIKKGRTTIYVEVKGKKLECVVNIN